MKCLPSIQTQIHQRKVKSSLLCIVCCVITLFLSVLFYQRLGLSTDSPLSIETAKMSIRILQENESASDNIKKYVLLMIIIFFVVVPVIAVIIFVALAIYKKCNEEQQEQSQDNPESAMQMNLEQYNIDEIGPYIANPNDQCVICLDKQINIRTFCGHFFHAPCLKTWFDKKASQQQRPKCPVCVGAQTNPIKIYCKKCYISIKLDFIRYSTSQQTISLIDSLQCTSCKKSFENNSFTQTEFTDDPQMKSNKSKKSTVSSRPTQNNQVVKKQTISKRSTKTKKLKRQKQVQEQANSNIKINVNHEI